MLWLGFRLRPATPGWGVGLCVCSCARSACTLPLLAGVRGVGVCVWARVSAEPRHSWLGCALSVCVLGLGFWLRPATPGWGLWCVGWLLPGTCSCAVVRCVLCALSGFVAPGGRRCLAPVRVPWLWPAACLSGVPRGPAWCAAPCLVRSLSLLRSAFPLMWCLSPARGLAPQALLGGCAGHAEAGREPGSLCLPLAPAKAGALGSLRVVPVRGPAMGFALAGPSGVGLWLRALRWLACVDPVTDASGFPDRPSFDRGLGRCPGAVLCGRRHRPLRVGGRHARVQFVCACACSSWPGRAGRPPGRVLVRLTFSFGRFGFLLCLAPSGVGLPPSWSLFFFFSVAVFRAPPLSPAFFGFRPRVPWALALCVVCLVGLALLGPPCALATFVLRAWLLVVAWWLPPPPPFCVSRFFLPPLRCLCFFFLVRAPVVSRFLWSVLGARCPPPFFFCPACAPVVFCFLWFPAPGAPGLGAVFCLLCGPPASRLSVRSPLFLCLTWPLVAPWWLLPPPPLLLGAPFFFFFALCDPVVSGFLRYPAPGALGLSAARCLLGWPTASQALRAFSPLSCLPSGRWLLPGGCCPPPFCVSWFSSLPLGAVCRVLCCAVCPGLRCCAALLRVVSPGVVLLCAVLVCCARSVPLLVVPCPLVLPVALGPCALRRCVLRCSPALCVFCRCVVVCAVVRRSALCCVCPWVLCCAFPDLSALCGAVLRFAAALALCCSCGACCCWRPVLWCAAVCCAVSFGVLWCSAGSGGPWLSAGAVLWRPAVRFPLLVVLVCVFSLCVRCCVALRVVFFGFGWVCAVVGASCCGVSLCVVVSPWAFCGVVVLLWCVVVSCCAVRCPVLSCALCCVLVTAAVTALNLYIIVIRISMILRCTIVQ